MTSDLDPGATPEPELAGPGAEWPGPYSTHAGYGIAADIELGLVDIGRPGLADVVELALEAGATALDVEIDGITASFRPSSSADAPERPLPAPLLPVQHRERLPWTNYAEPLREALKGLAAIYPPDMVAAAAAELEILIALHGRPRPAQGPAASV